MANFVLVGAAGYIAPRHLKAIKETGNDLLAILDPHDSVGIIDSYFPNSAYFCEFERFDRHICKLIESGINIDYVSICSPNYLHDAHIRFGLRIGSNVICEKPLVISPWNCDALNKMQEDSKGKVYSILQLRYHESIQKLKNSLKDKKYEIKLKYITSRGKWYGHSWKGDPLKSGGLIMNIGIHFFDMLIWLFGSVKDSTSVLHNDDHISGHLVLDRANIEWELSTDKKLLPIGCEKTYRCIDIDGEELEFSDGFTDLHTKSYREILDGNGYGILDAKPAIDLAYQIRQNCDIIR